MFESLKSRLDRLFADAGADPRARAEALREAAVEARAGLGMLRDALGATERELAGERKQLADAERRGRLAAGIQDAETVAVAERFTARHRERVTVLERKLAVQRDEVALAERDAAELGARVREASGPGAQAQASAEAAWRDITAAGGARPGADLDGELHRAREDQQRREQAADLQLEALKRKLGKQP